MLDFTYGVHMATLYVENVPDDVYKALRKRAQANRKSIAAEVIALLEQNIPTASELKRRRQFYDRLAEVRARPPEGPGPFPPVEDMIRQDRER
jgi:plasmid stability protein